MSVRGLTFRELLHLCTSISAFKDSMEKSQHINKIQPKSAVETPRIQPTVDKRIVTLDQHAAFAF